MMGVWQRGHNGVLGGGGNKSGEVEIYDVE